MNATQTFSDKMAISLSLLCTLHCLTMPLMVAFLPVIAGLPLQDEAFHLWLVVAIFPLSIFALTMGCKKHKRLHVLALGGIGLVILIVPVVLGHEVVGEILEKTLTVIGSIFVALGHVWNYRLCQNHSGCTDSKHGSEGPA